MSPGVFWLLALPWFAGIVALGLYQSRAFEVRTRWLQRLGTFLFAGGGLLTAYFHTGWLANECAILAVLGVAAIVMAKLWSDRLKRRRGGT